MPDLIHDRRAVNVLNKRADLFKYGRGDEGKQTQPTVVIEKRIDSTVRLGFSPAVLLVV